MDQIRRTARRRLARRWRAARRSVENARAILRGQAPIEPYQAAFDVVDEGPVARLRRYRPLVGVPRAVADPILLVPPLMVTSAVYDISPRLSAVGLLLRSGLDVWLVDFGAPERVEGGMERTLDDHVLAVDAAVTACASATRRPVHLTGYSQGGIFAYQAAAYRGARDVGSVITFGAPVDMHRNFPGGLHEDVAERLADAAYLALDGPLKALRGLPGSLTSAAFKLVSPRQEVKNLLKVLGILHDRSALAEHASKRRFLGGEGFTAWPGPAFQAFVESIIVGNALRDGGLVIAGQPVDLGEIRCPVLYFYGSKDDFARKPAVRAIRKVIRHARVQEVKVRAGHFGLVVGSRALREVWPVVADWVIEA